MSEKIEPTPKQPSTPPAESHKQEDPPTHYVVDTDKTAPTRYRPVPPIPDEPEQAIYVNQNLVGRVERELPVGKETALVEKPRRSPSKVIILDSKIETYTHSFGRIGLLETRSGLRNALSRRAALR